MLSNRKKYELYKPKKFLGQNFLVDVNLARKIVSSLDISPDDTVIEIGPGHGALTAHIVETDCKLIAVEIDKGIFEQLKEKFGKRIKILNEDFLQTDLKNLSKKSKSGKLKIIGNIPYNITSQILFKIFDNRGVIESAVIMMQKEVAMRLTAKPGTKDYGILAVNAQVFSSPKRLFNIPAAAFFPKPKVDSTVVKFTFENDKYIPEDAEFFREVLKAAFGKRRKTLRNSMAELINKYNVSEENLNIELGRRAESLSVEEFISFTASIINESSK